MKIKHGRPPAHIWDRANKDFDIDESRVLFTYDDTIYNPGKIRVDRFLEAHENVHIEQQHAPGMTPELWWQRWFDDPAFRAEQEAQAYGVQYRRYCAEVKDRRARHYYLGEISQGLSSGMYKLTVNPLSARIAILKRSQGV